jgi:intraflagellar transport protein 88
MSDYSQALEWYRILISVVPTDPNVLARMADLYLRENDKSQAFQYFSEVSEREIGWPPDCQLE